MSLVYLDIFILQTVRKNIIIRIRVIIMVCNATVNNISVTCISWWDILLLEETWKPGENHWPVASHWGTLSHNVVSSTPCRDRDSKSQL